MQERPHELPADVLEPKLEVGVLVDGVMAAEEGCGADQRTLLVGDLVGRDQARCVTGPRRGNRGVVWVRK